MEDLQFRSRSAQPQDGMDFQWTMGIVLAMFGFGTYVAVLTFVQHRRPMPDDAELTALRYAAPFLIGVLLASGNALAMLRGKRIPLVIRLLPVFALVVSIAASIFWARLYLV